MTDWLLLTAALPTSPSALRVRIWRALKASGCATLRDGVYLLPAHAASAAGFCALEASIRGGGAQAHLLRFEANDAAQEAAFVALFDRAAAHAEFAQSLKEARQSLAAAGARGSAGEAGWRTLLRRLDQRLQAIAATDLYAELLQSIKEQRAAIGKSPEADLNKSLRVLEQRLQAIQASDFFPGKAAAAASAGLLELRQRVDRRFSPGEPVGSAGAVPQLRREDFQQQTWATRRRPWVDRLATAWLVRRFIDPGARFLWIAQPARCPKKAIGFDFDGARFTHSGERVTFEVVVQAFGLGDDTALRRLGELVHCIDVGGLAVDEAAGIETLVRGLHARHADDDGLLDAALPLFDALHAAFGTTP